MADDFYTPAEAARLLGLTERHVRKIAGSLRGEQDEQGRWRIPAGVVIERRRERKARAESREQSPEVSELEAEVRDLQYRLGRAEGRLELTQLAQSTVEAERDRLLADLERERERALRLEAELGEARRPWWKRVFGG